MAFDQPGPQGLLEVNHKEGLIRLAGERAVVLDAGTLGILRKELVEQTGWEEARAILTRVGFAQGWRLAGDEAARAFNPGFLGLFRMESEIRAFLDDSFAGSRALLLDSFEAEQHVAHLGPSRVPACWVICGLASGYLSRVLGRDMEVREDRCAAMGDSRCHFLGRPREEWGADAPASALENAAPCALEVHSPAMRRLADLALRLAPVNTTILITGESGTGKERVARMIHGASRRASGAFNAVNCGAVAETLLESELFGHARGAFTGAVADRAGLFEAAQGGTLLLDEIGEISQAMQVKLLRVLQEREVRRVGENRSRPIDVRVIAATNSDLAAAMREGRFRKDLYYRLNVVELRVPPLRERTEDILPLARRFLAESSARMGSPVTALSPALERQLLAHPWPGNVRELENAMERAAALSPGTVATALAREPCASDGRTIPGGPVRPLAEIEKDYILAVLESNGGNQVRTALQLGIGSATLYRKLKRYGRIRPHLSPPSPAGPRPCVGNP